jgi:hypothetical protein
VFTADDTGRPFLTHNPPLLNALIPHLQANTPASPESVLARVRSVIAERVRGQRPTARAVARELATSTSDGAARKVSLNAEWAQFLAVPGRHSTAFHPDGQHVAFVMGKSQLEIWALDNLFVTVEPQRE